jgi:UDP-glucose 4-epimerase
MPRALVTGGAGFIGSHTVVELLAAGWSVVVVDDHSNSRPEALAVAERLGGATVDVVVGDIQDPAALDEAFGFAPVDAVVHFAGLKAVGESVEQPLRYWRTNVGGSIELLDAMRRHGVHDLVFSSSCTVYGEPQAVPITEDHPVGAMSPYGRTKEVIEDVVADTCVAEPGWRALSLRYFNPVGAHPSGDLGENPLGVPLNLMPYVMGALAGRYPTLKVFGTDYDTPDGTCIRDYIHVVDLAQAHVRALEALPRVDGHRAVNIGTGTGSSVLEVVAAVGRAVGEEVPYEVAPRRAGDITATWADTTTAEALLGWKAQRRLDEMCADAWRWQTRHPAGFEPA